VRGCVTKAVSHQGCVQKTICPPIVVRLSRPGASDELVDLGFRVAGIRLLRALSTHVMKRGEDVSKAAQTKAPWRPAPEGIRSKNKRLSAQSFTRRYEMVRDTVTVH